MREVIEIPIDPRDALVYPEGWQSWTPTTTYPVTAAQHGPADRRHEVMGYRGPMAQGAIAADGLLAVSPAPGEPVHIVAGAGPGVPRITARAEGGLLRITSDGTVQQGTHPGPLHEALRAWAGQRVAPVRPAPTVWCSWYQYFTGVTEAEVIENLDSMVQLDLPIDVVQLDDGYQTGIGVWLSWSGQFPSLREMAARIQGQGRRAGIWVAPFLVGTDSRLAVERPEWLVPGVWAGWNWEQNLAVLDTTQPGARECLAEVFSTLRGLGFDYFKLDLLYAGALPGPRSAGLTPVAAYRDGLELIREAVGADAYLAACGAPITPSIGLVDAMRVSGDVAVHDVDPSGDLSSPGLAGAMMSGASRRWQDGVWWATDPDCLLVRPGFDGRRDWWEQCSAGAGLRSISDRLADLDDWGVAAAREYLTAGR